MNRSQLEHLIRACGELAEGDEFVIVGSQSVLGAIPNPPEVLARSMEADIYPANLKTQDAEEIEGVLGEMSPFHDSHGIYAQTVDSKTATLPRNWRSRVVIVANENTGRGRGLCISPHDLAMAKYAAGREKDIEFNLEMARHRIVDREVLEGLVDEMPVNDELRLLIRQRIAYSFDPKLKMTDGATDEPRPAPGPTKPAGHLKRGPSHG